MNSITMGPRAVQAPAKGSRLKRDTEEMTIHPVNFLKALESVTGYWSPNVVERVNDQYVKVAKLKGSLAWHKHDQEDELFLVIYGSLRIEFKNEADVILKPGEVCIVPKGVLHNPVADEECGIVLIEAISTKHTGDVITPHTKSIAEQLTNSRHTKRDDIVTLRDTQR
jgi:mannose-6-phosphate isomerase-like protein (cupin superfamily)